MITCPAMMLGGGSYFEKWFLALMVQFLGYVDMAHETVDCSDCNQSGVTKKNSCQLHDPIIESHGCVGSKGQFLPN